MQRMIQRFMKIWLVAAVMILSLAASQDITAQTDNQMTQYYELPSMYNPAAIGLTDKLRVRAGGRMQWIGIDHAPRGIVLTGDMPLKIGSKRIGVGLVARSESAGLFRSMSVDLQAGYKQKLFKGELTASVQVGFANEVFKGTETFMPDNDDFHEGVDEAIPNTDVSGNALDLGAGVFYTHKWFWAGVSGMHLNAPTIKFGDDNGNGSAAGSAMGENEKSYEIQLRRTMYFMAGSNIPIKNTLFEVMPSVMVKSDFTFTSVEVSGRIRYKKFLTAGLGYRHDDAVSALLGAEFKGFYIGYSYDYPITAISKASSGSHEIVLGYSVKLNLGEKNRNKHKSIRIM